MKIKLYIKDLIYYKNVILHISNHNSTTYAYYLSRFTKPLRTGRFTAVTGVTSPAR
jgi:hypothetical protein